MTFRTIPLVFTILALLTLGTWGAHAQTTLALSTTVEPRADYSLGPGQEQSFTWTVTAAGADTVEAQVTPTLNTPTGWGVQADLTSFTLGGLNGETSRRITVRLSLPPDATDVRNGTLILTARGTQAGGQSDEATQSVFLTYVAPAAPPPPPPPNYTWLYVAIAAGVVLLGLAAYFFQAQRVRLTVENPARRFNVGTGGAYKVVVSNLGRRTQNVELRVTRLPKEWSAAFSFPTVPLNGRERSEVPLWVNVPLEATPNVRQDFRVQARPNRFSPWLVTRRLEINTLDVDIGPKRV